MRRPGKTSITFALLFVYFVSVDGLSHQVAAGTGVDLSLKNDFAATSSAVSYEQRMYLCLFVYLVFGLIADLSSTVKVTKWTSIVRVLPTYEMWRYSMPPKSPRRFQVCKDWMSSSTSYTEFASSKTTEEVEDQQLRECFSTMKKHIGDDPLAPEGYKPGGIVSIIFPLMAYVAKLAAGYFSMQLALEVIQARMTTSAAVDLSASDGIKDYLSVVLPTDSYLVVNMALEPFPSTSTLYSYTVKDVSPYRRALAAMCEIEDISTAYVFLENQDTMHFTTASANKIKLHAVLNLPDCVVGSTQTTACEEKRKECKAAVENAADLLVAINNEFQAAGMFKQHHLGHNIAVPSPVKTVQSVSSSVVDVQNDFQNSPSHGKLQCSTLGSLGSTHSSAYDHVELDAPCASGVHFGAVCEVRCKPGYMTGDRWGRYAMCGFHDTKGEGDGALKWLPAGKAYQELCAPDPVHRTAGAALHFSGESPLWKFKHAVTGTSPGLIGWQNTIGSKVTHAYCINTPTPCADMHANNASSGGSITWYSGSVDQSRHRQLSWSGNAPPLLVGGSSFIADTYGADPSYKYFDSGRPSEYGRFRTAVPGGNTRTDEQQLVAAIEHGITLMVVANVSSVFEINNLQSIVSFMHVLDTSKATAMGLNVSNYMAISQTGTGTPSVSSAHSFSNNYVKDGHVLLSIRANCTQAPERQRTRHSCVCKRPCASHTAPPHGSTSLASLTRAGESIELKPSSYVNEAPAYDYCFVRPNCKWDLLETDVNTDDDRAHVSTTTATQYHWDWCTPGSGTEDAQTISSVSVRVNGVEFPVDPKLDNPVRISGARPPLNNCSQFVEYIKLGAISSTASSYGSIGTNTSTADLYQYPNYIGAGCNPGYSGIGCEEKRLEGDVGEFAMFTRYLGQRQLEMIEFFMATKWNMASRVAASKPPAVSLDQMHCDAVSVGRQYACDVLFPALGKHFYNRQNFRARACHCMDPSPAAKTMTADRCVTSGTCRDLAFGTNRHRIDSVVFGASENDALRIVLQVQNGKVLEGDDLRMWSTDRPPWLECTSAESHSCWVTGMLSGPLMLANITQPVN